MGCAAESNIEVANVPKPQVNYKANVSNIKSIFRVSDEQQIERLALDLEVHDYLIKQMDGNPVIVEAGQRAPRLRNYINKFAVDVAKEM